MKAKPKVGQRLRLLAHAQKSRSGFSIEVEVVEALTQADSLNRSLRPRAEGLDVRVRLPDGSLAWVQRGDLVEENHG